MSEINKNVSLDVVGTRLKKLRLESNLSCEDVANYCNLTKGLVYNYERGVRRPSYDVMVLLANLYGVKVQDIFFS